MKPNTYKNVSAALELLHYRNANVRAAFGDVSKLAEFDQLVCAYVAAHPEFRGNFAAIGFSSALAPTLLAPLPQVDIRTACGHTHLCRSQQSAQRVESYSKQPSML